MVFSSIWNFLYALCYNLFGVVSDIFDLLSRSISENINMILGDGFVSDIVNWILDHIIIFGTSIGEYSIISWCFGPALPAVLIIAIIKFFGDIAQ